VNARSDEALMDAVVLKEFGPPESLCLSRVPVPAIRASEVLIRVTAVSLNRTLDLELRAGKPPFGNIVSPPHVLGADHTGRVIEVGSEVTRVKIGDRVAIFPVLTCGVCDSCTNGRSEICQQMELIGVHRPGSNAELVAVPESSAYPIPEAVEDRDACALVLVGSLAHRQLSVAELESGNWIFVPGAAGALGANIIALALHRGIRVVAGIRNSRHGARLRQLGAELVVDPLEPNFKDQIRELTAGAGIQAVIDNLGDAVVWRRGIEVLSNGGTVVCSGALGGAEPTLDLRQMYLRNHHYLGVRTARPEDVVAILRELDAGFRGVIDDRERFSIAKASAAHRYLERGGQFGRVVLDVI